ncbi:MAG: hypothetical protein PHY90_03265, partial [Desulfitobacteriaceae bacterium]|nr:hypothetical protein [Desulfitobacteriaceae bacterium]
MAWKIQVYRRRDYLWRKAPAFVLLLLLIIGFYLGIKLNGLVVPVSRIIIGADVSAERRIVGAFYQVLPVASYNGLNYVEDEATGLLLTAMEDMTNVNLADPASFFETQLAHFNSAQPVTAEPEVLPSGGVEFSLPEKVDEASPLDETKPLVAIYCTHNAECYTPSQGQEK